jgi:hypothetical protein
MARIVYKRGDTPLTYTYLLFSLEQYKINYQTLQFAQGLLANAIRLGIEDQSYNPQYKIYEGDPFDYIENGIIDETKIVTHELQRDIIKGLFNRFQYIRSCNIEEAITSLGFQNYHFIRTRFINSVFEILEKYILKYQSQFNKDDGKRTGLRTELQKRDWYVILYILRNNASHADGLHEDFSVPRFLKDSNRTSYKWRTITVEFDQPAHSIIYTDRELLELYDEMFQFILFNEALFTQDHKGQNLPALIP